MFQNPFNVWVKLFFFSKVTAGYHNQWRSVTIVQVCDARGAE